MKITRCEKWHLSPSLADRQVLEQTVEMYRQFVHALRIIMTARWSTCGTMGATSGELQKFIEALIHPTGIRPHAPVRYFQQRFYKFPSYLRRSAIADAHGQVASFMTRYDQWQSNARRRHKFEAPPASGSAAGCWPSLYKGQCIKFDDRLTVASIKVFDNGDWVWRDIPIKRVGKRAQDVLQKRLSPQLIINRKGVFLGVPYEQNVTLGPQEAEVVCSVDLGINTTITASIVRSDGTVLARRFIHRARDIDRLHKRLEKIRVAARKTKRLTKGFASSWYRKGYAIAKNAAHHMTRKLVDFAASYGATTLVFERLKGWRPKAPRRGLRNKFHTWLHRRIVEFSEWKWREKSGRMAFVHARDTSKQAYDGSGPVVRSVDGNYSICRFKSGKVYNADLNATYNIAAKYFLRGREPEQLCAGKRSSNKPRIPATLSLLWNTHVLKAAA